MQIFDKTHVGQFEYCSCLITHKKILTVLGLNIFFTGSLFKPPISGVRVRLFGHIRAGGNRPEEGVPRLGGRLLWADWALDLFPVVAVTKIIYRFNRLI